MGILGMIVLGGIAGWLASVLFKGKGSGLLVNIVIVLSVALSAAGL